MISPSNSLLPYKRWDRKIRFLLASFYPHKDEDNFGEEQKILSPALSHTKGSIESYLLHYEMAWHHLRQRKVEQSERVSLNQQKQPASLDELCALARTELAIAFNRLTGLKIKGTNKPDYLKKLLMEHYLSAPGYPADEKPFRDALRKIMSSFGHSYGYQLQEKPGDGKLHKLKEDFYDLKTIADPEYIKIESKVAVRKYSKINVYTAEEFEALKGGL